MRQAGRRGDWTHARTRGALLAAIAALAPLALSTAPAAGQTPSSAPRLSGAAPGPTGTPALGAALAPAVDSAVELFELEVEVEVEGFGSGAVTSSPAGIDACGPAGGHACHASFAGGATVILTASAGPDTEFVKWEGCTRAVGGECKVKMSEEREVTAIFDTYPELTVEVGGSGDGTVTSSPAGIDACAYAGGHACDAYFKKGATVTLTPTAEPGSEFVEWKGCTTVVGSKCEIAMSEEEQEVTAVFAFEPVLEVELEVEGAGAIAVTSSPPGIDCGPGSSACTAPFAGGSTVTLTAAAKSSSKFVEWKGCPDAVGAECKVTLRKGAEEEMRVTAVFDAEPLPEHPLTVFIAGAGEVELNPGAIKCSTSECKHEFAEGAVTLTARQKAGSEYEFSGWTGCEKPSGTTCTIDLTSASEVTAVFAKAGVEGPAGPPGNEGSKGAEGPSGSAGGEGANGEAGAPDAGGANGGQDEQGATGSTAATSAQGPALPAGPAGTPGPGGSAGKVELVTCKTVALKDKQGGKQLQKCTTKLVSGTVELTATATATRATLSRDGQLYATGAVARGAPGHLSLRLLPLRKLRPGRYTLELITGAGAHKRIRRETFVLGGGKQGRSASASDSAVELFELEVEVEVEGFGSGAVTSSPAGIDACGPAGGHACHASFAGGATVTLTANAGPDTEFVEWKGCTRVLAGKCEVKMSQEEQEVTAVFDAEPELEVEVEGSGDGAVTSSPAGIDACSYAGGHACHAVFKKGATVTLTPTAKPGSEFVEWKGCTKVLGSKCEIAMSEEEQEVTAVFDLDPELEAELHPTKSSARSKDTNTNSKQTGPTGPAGAQGPAGRAVPAGKVELVTCDAVTRKRKHGKKAKQVQKCTTKLVTGAVTTTGGGHVSRATLSHNGQVYATGTAARDAHGNLRLRLLPRRKLRPGRYTLELITGSGAHKRIRREALVLGGGT